MRALTPIAPGSTGAPVADLHAALDRLDRGSGVPPEERAEQRYGHGTAAAVREFQEDIRLGSGADGEVDAGTATALNELLFASAQFGLVDGTLRTPTGTTVAGAVVEAADAEFLDPGESGLGQTVSDAEGSYRLFYDPAHYARLGPGIDRVKARVDLVVRVRDRDGTVLAQSMPRDDLHRVEHVDLTLPHAPAHAAPSGPEAEAAAPAPPPVPDPAARPDLAPPVEADPAPPPAPAPAPPAPAPDPAPRAPDLTPAPAPAPAPARAPAPAPTQDPAPAPAPAPAAPPPPANPANPANPGRAAAAPSPADGVVPPPPTPSPAAPPRRPGPDAPLLPFAPDPPHENGGPVFAAVAATRVTGAEVRGRVFTDARVPVPGLKVTAADVFLADELPLGEAVTDARGGYRIVCDLSASRARGATAPDLLVRVLDEQGAVLAAGPVAFSAGPDTQVDLAVPSAAFRRPVEYEQLTASLPGSLEGSGLRMAELTETPERPQITYLANKTGWDARMIAMASLADRFAEGSEIPAPLYYALFRAGVAARPGVLGRLDRPTVEEIWRGAVTEGIVPAALGDRLPELVERFAAEGSHQLLDQPLVPDRSGSATLGDLLAAAGLDDGQKERFAAVYHARRHDLPAMWEEAATALAAVSDEAPDEALRTARLLTEDIRLTGKLALLTGNVPPLVSRLRGRVEDRDPVSLVAQGLHRPENWDPLLAGLDVPEGMPGEGEPERRASYAKVLAGQLALSYPTATVAAMVAEGDLAREAEEPVRDELRGFLTDHQGSFELGVHPVDGFVREHGISLGSDALAELRTLQRLYQISPSDSAMAALAARGIDSAYAAVRHGERAFVALVAEDLGGEEQARLTYAKAHQVHHAVLNLAAGYLTARAAPALRAVPDPFSGAVGVPGLADGITPGADGAATPVAAPPDSADLESLFGGLDFVACAHCRSVLSPAAYLVDLLLFLDRAPSDTDGAANPLDVLLERRPDLAHTELTCENTNTTLPYVDLVNEVLEHFAVHNFSLSGFEGFDVPAGADPEAESARLAAAPDHTQNAAYTALRDARHPLTLPFHRDLEEVRAHLGLARLTLDSALEVLGPGDGALDPPPGSPETAYALRDVLTERLRLSRQERRLLTDGSMPWHELLGADVADTTEAEAITELSSARTLARRLGVTPTELTDLLRCRFVNPAVALLPRLERLGVGFADLRRLHSGELTPSAFTEQFLAGQDPEAFGGDIPGWILAQHDLIMSLITLTDPASEGAGGRDADDGSAFDRLELRRALPDPAANRLTPPDFRRLTRFVRLRRALGWTVELTDAALVALFPASPRQPADPAKDPAVVERDRFDRDFAEVLLRLAHVKTAMELLGVEPGELPALLACWAPLDTAGPRSLYHRLFLGPGCLPAPAFEDDGYGNVPGARDARLTDQAAQLQAATALDAAGLADTFTALGVDEETPLTLENVSAVFRHGWLSRRLGLAPADLVLLTDLSGIDPFAPLTDTAAEPPRAGSPPLVRLTELARRLDAAGLAPARLRLLLRHEDRSGHALPPVADIRALAEELHQDLVRIDAEITVAVEDPTGELGRARLALLYGTEAADTFFGLLDSTVIFSTPYAQPQPQTQTREASASYAPADAGLPPQPDLPPGLSYDAFAGTLSHRGAVPTPVLDAVRDAHGRSSALASAVEKLHGLSRADAEEFFTRYPDLRSAHTVYVDAPGPREDRMRGLLDGILPGVRDRLQRRQVHQRLADECGVTSAEIAPLLDDAALLGSSAAPGRPAVEDALALARTGLTLTVGGEPATAGGTEHRAGDKGEAAKGSSSGSYHQETVGHVAGSERHGYLNVPDTSQFTFTVSAAAAAEYTLAVDGTDIPLTPGPGEPGTSWTSGPVALSAGPLAELRLTASREASPVLGWEARGRAREAVPEAALRPAAEFAAFTATWIRLTKVLDLARTLGLSAPELAYFAAHPDHTIDGASWLQAVPVVPPHATRDPEGTRERALFFAADTLARYVALRRDLAVSGDTLLAVLRDPDVTGPDGRPLRSTLPGWDESALDGVLLRTGLSPADLASVTGLGRVTAVFGLAATTRVSTGVLLDTLTNEPGPEAAVTVRQAVRAHYDEAGWLELLRPLNDGLRRRRRDALTAYALHGLARNPATRAVDTPDKLFEHTLIDVQMDPCMQTSRIKQAISTVQLFVQRVLLNLEPRVSPAAVKAGQWEWMKRYRTWEANRTVFLYPENWLEPELRDDKSPQFRELESKLLAGDITDDAAATAIGHYLEDLAAVAKLEILCVFVDERDTGPSTGAADDVVHVVARGGGGRREHYYRRRAQGTWSPWERIGPDVTGDHLTMTVWNGRLLLFWLVLREEPVAARLQADQPLNEMRGRDVPTPPMVRMTTTLNWSEYSNGRWQSARTSDPNRPLQISGLEHPGGFDRQNLALFPAIDADDRLWINLAHVAWHGGYAFVLDNLHSAPAGVNETRFFVNPEERRRYVSVSGGVSLHYDGPLQLDHTVLHRSEGLTQVFGWHALDNPYEAPFFLQNRRRVFFVRPQVSQTPIGLFDNLPVPFDPVSAGGPLFPGAHRLPEEDLVLPERDLPRPHPDLVAGLVAPAPVETLLGSDGRIRTVLDGGDAVLFDGLPIGPAGSLDGTPTAERP
ncbi:MULTISPECIES: neuraminidase-like domain-containing protein [unclassified Streptomyces]|uniref:neuraminidase-like domain-containing protein n=1 Tax=Streptomyces sp. NPDC127129 TaxID=3345373 RepID=UPI00362922D0